MVSTYSSDAPHGVMDTTWPESSLNNLETSALSKNHIRRWHAHVLKRNVSMSMRCVVVSEHAQRPLDGNSGGIGRHENDRLLPVHILIPRVRLAHNNINPAPLIRRARRPPLGPIKHIAVPVLSNLKRDIRGITRRHIRLGHQKRGADLALKQRPQPRVLVRLRAVLGQHLHVARVGRRAVARLARRPALA